MTTIKVTPPWLPEPHGFTCRATCRCAEHLTRAAAQFGVQCNHRYDQDQPHLGDTHCNGFAWDFTTAMDKPIPHWVDAEGNPVAPFTAGAVELNANGQIDWLRTHGLRFGWREVELHEVNSRTVQGFPCVLTYFNEGFTAGGVRKPGHIAPVLPPLPDSLDIRLAQAGSVNAWDVSYRSIFGSLPMQAWTAD